MSTVLLIFLSILELLLLGALFLFFRRLKRSEEALEALQEHQDAFLAKLRFNTDLEEELVASFTQRQQELAALDKHLEERAAELKLLMDKAANLAKSPGVLRRMILDGHRQGTPVRELARTTGLSLDEVELILAEAKP